MSYPEAERISEGRSRSLIADLMPRTPVYVGLLPPTAQMSIGQLHPVGQLPFEILFREGFEADIYVDVFDAGPTVVAHLDQIATVRAARSLVTMGAGAGRGQRAEEGGVWHLMAAGDRGSFRACLGRVAFDGASLPSDHEAALRLQVRAGDGIDVAPLRLDRGGREDGDEA
jgi:arginine N-succinyltransferase